MSKRKKIDDTDDMQTPFIDDVPVVPVVPNVPWEPDVPDALDAPDVPIEQTAPRTEPLNRKHEISRQSGGEYDR